MADSAIFPDLVSGRRGVDAQRQVGRRGFAIRSQFCLSGSDVLGLYGRPGTGGDFAFVQNCARFSDGRRVMPAESQPRQEGMQEVPEGDPSAQW